ncbi:MULTISPECIES: IS110 family transposase [Bacillales]|uniref:IS110 family transposase n=1 Tax=Bacillales TaxID=1385 RepID=UPI0020C4EF45|nr:MULTISPECIES: IS110 family transposase [Bacillales]UWS61981.1 IS110 family transposase [Bacillus paralicheniformis]CAH8767752.1 IS110 family transposase [Paenibacillus dendritiformis]CAH8768426.1 IS110 family transposase [Paenibacillus dendritiformis]CAH8770937.1 IS110 family transposase [Paenibacillus dendritiformis]CAH8771731.1 IS110 family transposase [Paenibacillus dendritiformis]
MDAVRECCCGLDVHQKTVVACILYGDLESKPKKVIESFGTTTTELLRLQDWLNAHECKEVAMESTGVLWKPVWNILESSCYLVLANAKQIKNTPGRKTDKKDAEWIAQLHRCGLIQPSVVLPQHLRDLRDLTRYRLRIVVTIASEKNRIHKILQDGNIKLTSFMSDLFGVSGRLLLEKLMDGEVLVEDDVRELVKTKLKTKVPQLVEALNGQLRRHHRVMMRAHWKHLLFEEAELQEIESLIDEQLEPYRKEIECLDSIPGIDKSCASAIFAEMGPDIATRFPTVEQFTSWAGVSPGNNESAGRKKSRKCLQGNKYLKRSITQAAWANYRSRNRIGEHFRRIRKRRGEKTASVATGHLLIKIIYAMMKEGTPYKEIDMQVRMSKQRTANFYVKKLQELGFALQLTENETS